MSLGGNQFTPAAVSTGVNSPQTAVHALIDKSATLCATTEELQLPAGQRRASSWPSKTFADRYSFWAATGMAHAEQTDEPSIAKSSSLHAMHELAPDKFWK
jgi:hypothetical protein